MAQHAGRNVDRGICLDCDFLFGAAVVWTAVVACKAKRAADAERRRDTGGARRRLVGDAGPGGAAHRGQHCEAAGPAKQKMEATHRSHWLGCTSANAGTIFVANPDFHLGKLSQQWKQDAVGAGA